MTPRRYELSDFEWSIIEPLLPNKLRGVAVPEKNRLPEISFEMKSEGMPSAIVLPNLSPKSLSANISR